MQPINSSAPLPSSDLTPDFPANKPCQNSAMVQPNGLATPIPVTTTLSLLRTIHSSSA
jgi:hypothetical protein